MTHVVGVKICINIFSSSNTTTLHTKTLVSFIFQHPSKINKTSIESNDIFTISDEINVDFNSENLTEII